MPDADRFENRLKSEFFRVDYLVRFSTKIASFSNLQIAELVQVFYVNEAKGFKRQIRPTGRE